MCKAQCVICGIKPARTERGYCHNCDQKIDSIRMHGAQTQSILQQHKLVPTYMTYKDAVVKLEPHTTDEGLKYRPRLVKTNPEKLPKSRTLNLNEWCDGYTREQIKRFKSTIMTLAAI